MVEVTKEVISGPVELDVCRKCQFMWFDPGESEAMPALPPNAEPEMHPKAREALALAEIEGFRSRHEPGILDPPDEWWTSADARRARPRASPLARRSA